MKTTLFILLFMVQCLFSQTDKQIIFSKNAPKPIGPYSQAVKVGNFLYLSGQIAIDSATGKIVAGTITEEVELVMKNIKAVLNEAGYDMENIIKTTIFLADINDFPKVNAAYSKFFKEKFPARETVQVAALPMKARIEISVIGYK